MKFLSVGIVVIVKTLDQVKNEIFEKRGVYV